MCIQDLLDQLTKEIERILGTNLVGVYLHGSLAMGCFNPDKSDVDILVIIHKKSSHKERRELADLLIRFTPEATKKGFEISMLTELQLNSGKHPMPFDFHVSNLWIERFKDPNSSLSFEGRLDPDLAAHLTITKQRGKTLYGEPISRVFLEVTDLHYRDAILIDAKDILEDITKDPVYGILNLCRVRAYLEERIITSKLEGAEWGIGHSKSFEKRIIELALLTYKNDKTVIWDTEDLNKFADTYSKYLDLKSLN